MPTLRHTRKKYSNIIFRLLPGALVFCLCFGLPTSTFAQDQSAQFSGVVHYAIIVTAEYSPRANDVARERMDKKVAQVEQMFGDVTSMYFAPGKLKITSNGYVQEELFQFEQGRLLRLEREKDVYNVMDTFEPQDHVFGYDTLADGRNVLGYACKGISLLRKRTTTEYYYSPDMKLNPEDFEDVRLENWNVYTRLAPGVPLEIVKKFNRDKYTIRYVATAVEAMAPVDMEQFFRPSAEISSFASAHQKEIYTGLRKIQTLDVGKLFNIQVSKSYYMKDNKAGEQAWVIVNHGYAAKIGMVVHSADEAASIEAALDGRVAQTQKGLSESTETVLEDIHIQSIGTVNLREVRGRAGKSMAVNYLLSGFKVKDRIVTIRIESPAAEYDYFRPEYMRILASVHPR